jgi:hypothetical protein
VNYLESFLAQYAITKPDREYVNSELTKLPEDPSVGFVSGVPRRLGRVDKLSCALAVHEVLDYPAAMLARLPIATTLVVVVPGIARPLLIATHAGCPIRTFSAPEWLGLVTLAEAGKATSLTVLRWAQHPRCRQLVALDDKAITRCVVTVAQVLCLLGATLRAVVLEEQQLRTAAGSDRISIQQGR